MKQINLIITILLVSTLGFSQSEITSENILLMNDSTKLPGTLTYNKALKKQPLAIFIHGSGSVDRNGNPPSKTGANYIKQLSEALNKNNIAFYRFDKRTASRDNMKFLMKGISFNDFVSDIELVLNHFKNDDRFSDITLIGHSQGSLIGMLASTNNTDKFVSLSGPSESIDNTMIGQIRKQNGDSIANIVKSHFKELKSTGKVEKIDLNLMAIFNPINQKFFSSWMAYKPTEEILKVNIPTLIINGTKDLQVFETDANKLYKAKPNSSLKIIKNMNHMLKTITQDADNLKSYGSPDFPLSEELVNVITEFIKQ